MTRLNKLTIRETISPKIRSVPTTTEGAREVRLNSITVPSAPTPAEENPVSPPMMKLMNGNRYGFVFVPSFGALYFEQT